MSLALTALALMLSSAPAEDAADIAPVTVSDALVVPDLVSISTEPAPMPGAAGTGTTLRALFESVERHAPQVLAAQAEVEAAQAKALEALGAFDTKLDGLYFGRATGFYGGQIGEVKASRRLEDSNIELFGAYSLSGGTFPIYEDDFKTNRFGEVKVGGRAALLRGREIDNDRIKRRNTQLGIAQAGEAAAATLITIRADAATAYVNWLYQERLYNAQSDLRTIAENRQQLLERAVKAGQQAEITLDENRQLILARQSAVLRADQARARAQALLSLYLRGEDGEPQQPTLGPQTEVPDSDPFVANPAPEIATRVADARPDLLAMRLKLSQLDNQRRLAENDRQPTLDFKYEIHQDIGNGSPTREGTDHILGLDFSVPLERRAARGREAQATAQIKALRADLRLIEDQILAALVANQVVLTRTRDQILLSEREIKIAARLREAEETRYINGASDIFRLNTQESLLASSRIRLIEAQRVHELALVEYFRITGTLWTQL